MQLLSLVLFYVFAAVTLIGALGVVFIKSPMRAAVALLVSFLGVAALFFLRHAEFLGAVQLLVYAGGILVLFLFAIMFVSQKTLPGKKKWQGQWPAALVLGILFVFLVLHFVKYKLMEPSLALDAFVAEGGNTEALGIFLYRNYLVPFEVASLFLLVAMVGAILLGKAAVKK